MVYGGLAIGAETIASPFAVITLSSGTFDAQQPDASRSGEMHTVQWQAPATAVTRTATQARQSNSVDLDKARLVVSVGRGIGSKENISLAEALCQTIGAELACSRPVAENEKWMEHERYVGISNLMLKPELYLAVGISGRSNTWSAPTARRRFSPSTKIKTRQSSSMRILASLAMR